MPGFEVILGHDQIKEHFRRAIEIKKVSHAYILSGEAGMGKKSLAKAFALALLCQEGKNEPCMTCNACKQVLSSNHPDLIYVTHEKPSSIGVDDIREQINETIWIRPYSSRYKIYIVNEAEKMTVQAQNALLKTIEEPPDYAMILLLTTSQEVFLSTILSRCVQMKLKPLQDYIIKNYLIEKLQTEEEKADIYTAFARGNLGKGIRIASSEDFQAMIQDMLHLMKNICLMDISELLDYIRRIKEDKLDNEECLDFIEMWYRDILLFKATGDRDLLIFKNEYPTILKISDESSYSYLEKILNEIVKARKRMNFNVNMELAMELLLLTIKER
ncbi:MAG: DNA polymerase III subunit delta' [Lachnospiraceae bacterium]|nr:DNA polymerase III subunit delta' [Lachnospiraceae bacterium]